jgi:hypothetical protein
MVDGCWIDNWLYCTLLQLSQITITCRLVFSVMLPVSSFQQCSGLGFCAQQLLFSLTGTLHLQLPSWANLQLHIDSLRSFGMDSIENIASSSSFVVPWHHWCADCIENTASNSYSIVACVRCLAMSLVLLCVTQSLPSNGGLSGSLAYCHITVTCIPIAR